MTDEYRHIGWVMGRESTSQVTVRINPHCLEKFSKQDRKRLKEAAEKHMKSILELIDGVLWPEEGE